MRIFLTGGSGFLGQHVIRGLRDQGHTVVALARSAASAQKVTDAGAEPVRGDLSELGDHAQPTVSLVWLDRLRDVDGCRA